ncbi:TonB-dependent receptor domain-containing protein [Marinibaculum pumilum]|uniref:TonB-dependent receptor domain-containing protein n=1 Tax=Marinibaculum pumilum TaxID=1766165 RepID=A0ABV7L120_9PROT
MFRIDDLVVAAPEVHRSQQVRDDLDEAMEKSRTDSTVSGSVIQNVSPVNKLDAVRYNTVGIVNQPGTGNRFGGSMKIRTFGDWGASESINGLPAFKSAGEEGGGYGNTFIPSIAVDRINVLKGGRAVEFGNGSDGGVLETLIKSGRDYDNHQAITLDGSSAREGLVQGEAGDHTDNWDYYVAGSGFYGDYKDEPADLDNQSVFGGIGNFGWNLNDDTRAELLVIGDKSKPVIYRNGNKETITHDQYFGGLTLDHRINEATSLRVGALANNSHTVWAARSRDRAINTRMVFGGYYMEYALTDSITYNGSVGGEFRHTNYKRDNQWDNKFNDPAVLTRHALTFDDNLVLNLGLRNTWFHNDIKYLGADQPDNLQTDSLLSYDVGASYSVLPDTRLRASAATGYNRFYEKYGNFGADALNPAGAEDSIVDSRTLEVGARQGWAGGYFDAAVYNIVQNNVPRRNGGAIQNVKVDQTGVELEAGAQITPKLFISAGYAHLFKIKSTLDDGTDANGNIFFGANGVSVPRNQANARITYAVTSDIGLWTAGYYSTGYEAVDLNGNVTKRDGFERIDLGGDWAITDKVVLRARVENLTNEKDFGTTVSGTAANTAGNLGRVFWIGTDFTF